MATRADDELRMLQARAYGPAADIHRDEAAAERLRHLEDRRDPAGAAPLDPPDEGAVPTPDTVEAEPPADAAPARRWWPRPVAVVWAASLVATALVSVGIARFAVQTTHFHPFAPGAAQVAALAADPSAPVPTFFAVATDGSADDDLDTGIVLFEGFSGMTVASMPHGGGPDDPVARCLWVAPDEIAATDGGLTNGTVWYGCPAGAFPATVSFVVDAQYPAALRAAYPDGTALEFVLDESEDTVIVLAAAEGDDG